MMLFSFIFLLLSKFTPTPTPTLLSGHCVPSVNISLTEYSKIAFIRDRLAHSNRKRRHLSQFVTGCFSGPTWRIRNKDTPYAAGRDSLISHSFEFSTDFAEVREIPSASQM